MVMTHKEIFDEMNKTSRGSNIVGVGAYNERLILSMIREAGALSKVELTRSSGLSKQTLTVLVGRLEESGLLIRREPERGRVGQPLVPFALNPDGAYTLGLKIGRKSYDLILMNFTGEIVRSYSVAYLYPTPEKLMAFLTEALSSLHKETTPDVLAKLIGFGVAMPDELWNWSDEMGAPEAEMARWKSFDVVTAIKPLIDTPVHKMNDASAACIAELVFGSHPRHSDFQYFYVGPFIGGGLVLNGTIFTGSRSNAGAVGSMLTFDDNTSLAKPRQLLSVASTITLQHALERANKNFEILWEADGQWEGIDEFLGPWIDQVASHLAVAAVNAVSLVDVPRVIIDGSVPLNVRDAIVARTADIVRTLPTAGLLPFEIVCGSLGFAARAIGAASLPLHATFSYDPDALLKAAVAVV